MPAAPPRRIDALTADSERLSVTTGSLAPGGLSYSLVRRNDSAVEVPAGAADLRPGDVVRIRVSSPVAGNLSLEQQHDSGWLVMVVGFPVGVGTVTTLDPDIAVLATPQRFRLVLTPTSGAPLELQFQIMGH